MLWGKGDSFAIGRNRFGSFTLSLEDEASGDVGLSALRPVLHRMVSAGQGFLKVLLPIEDQSEVVMGVREIQPGSVLLGQEGNRLLISCGRFGKFALIGEDETEI